MSNVNVTLRTGECVTLEARSGASVMEVMRDGGIDEIMAICGGCCSCATCHVYVDEKDWDRLTPASDDERELLEFSEHPMPRSRLSCQIRMSADLNGLSVTVATED